MALLLNSRKKLLPNNANERQLVRFDQFFDDLSGVVALVIGAREEMRYCRGVASDQVVLERRNAL